MGKHEAKGRTAPEAVISIIGPGMRVVGDVETDGTVRIEGRVEGSIRAGKAVVVGKDGVVVGDILTQDAVIGGTVDGTLVAESRLELQASCRIDGEIRARRMQLDEGAVLNGQVVMGEGVSAARPAPPGAGAGGTPGGAGAGGEAPGRSGLSTTGGEATTPSHDVS